MEETHTAYLILGSNLGDRQACLLAAERSIEREIGHISGRSRVYETEPWGVASGQAPYLNKVVEVQTTRSPRELLTISQEIERKLGRTGKESGAPRLIDIDILFFDDLVMSESDLQIPHAKLHQRNFVLKPLLDLAPNLRHPVFGRTVEEMFQLCEDKKKVQIFAAGQPDSRGVMLPYRYIAVEGNIGVGKTTFCRMLERDLGARLILEQFADNPFLANFYEQQERYAFPVELFFMSERHKQLEEELRQIQLFDKLLVSDYLFVKTLLFARNNLSDEEFRLFRRLFEVLNNSFAHPDLIVYLHRPVEELMAQIRRRGRDYEKNIEATYLSSIQDVYMQYLRSHTESPVLVLDVSGVNFEQDEMAFRQMKSLLAQTWKPGIHRERICTTTPL